MLMRRAAAVLLTGPLLFGAALCSPSPSAAQSYPAKPVRMVVPLAAGGGVDLIARVVAAKMSEGLGEPVVVENRAGANGAIGSEAVAHAPADGYTILFATPSSHVTSILLSKNVRFDPVKDFTPIAAVAEPVTCLAVHPSVAATSVKELIAYAKRNPGKLAYGSPGVGSVFHLTGEMFAQDAGVELLHVPYKGTGASTADAVAGQILLVFASVNTVLPYVRQGKLRLLAVLEAARYPGLPDVPTVGETLPGFVKPASWYGVFGPAGLQTSVQMRLNREIVHALQAADVRARFEDAALVPIGNTPEEFLGMLKSGIEIYGKAVKAAGLKQE
jgi:tripartite-type tricarboxylate transporter receptor subunit TctC